MKNALWPPSRMGSLENAFATMLAISFKWIMTGDNQSVWRVANSFAHSVLSGEKRRVIERLKPQNGVDRKSEQRAALSWSGNQRSKN
ncbi:MAG: hypothetical protein JKY27_02740 [Magnetovibrio sp.]|nr:hypothetical protein [Magnetovibrio sp.]